MNAIKYLVAAAILVCTTTLHAAEAFVSHYEPLYDVALQSADDPGVQTARDPRRIGPAALSFEALGRRFDLNLEANDRVLSALPADAVLDGISVYRGRLANNPDSWVRIVMYDGMPRGLVWDGETMFAIEVPGDSATDISEPVIYRLADLNIAPGTMSCGATSLDGNAAKAYAVIKGELGAVSQAPGAVSEITMSVIGDASFTSAHGGDAGAVAAMSARFNNIDGYYSEQVGVQLTVELFETHDNASDPFTGTDDPGTLLDELSEYRLQNSAHNSRGLTHLYTGRNFAGQTVGVAWRGALCDDFLSAGLSEGRVGLTIDSLIAAHEIGHNFGAEHDGEAGSSCANEPQTFIMAPAVTGNEQFSACSIDVMQQEAAGASCVTALPAVDVAIDQAGSVSTVLLGANTVIEYDVSVNGTLNASGVVADFTLPTMLTLDSIASSSGTCSSGAGTASCDFGDLPGQSDHTVTLTTTPSAVGAGTLSASVSTTDTDERPVNDQDALQLTVDPAVDLVVDGPATTPVFVDNSATVTVALDNLSILPATNLTVSVTLASGIQASAATWSAGSCTVAAQQVDCQASSLAAQSGSSLRITVTAVAVGTQDVSISFAAAEADANPADNDVSLAVSVVAEQSQDDDSGGGSTNPFMLMLLALAGLARRRSR